MPRIDPLARAELPQFAGVIDAIGQDHGYVPNSFLTLGRVPGLLAANGLCADALWYDERLSQPVRRLTGFAFSFFSGAMYSAAHLAHRAEEHGLPREKLLAIADYEHSPVYDDAERAILRLCRHAARMPAEVTDRDMELLRDYFDRNTILLLTGLIAWHAFLNRWNDIMATRLEGPPREYAETYLQLMGWSLKQHD